MIMVSTEFVKKKFAAAIAAAQMLYFLRKDLQSVHWSWVGLAS